MEKPISLSIGVINIGIAIANSIDSLFGLTDIIQKSSKASVELIKLKEHVDMELNLSEEKRSSAAEVFVKILIMSIYLSWNRVRKCLKIYDGFHRL